MAGVGEIPILCHLPTLIPERLMEPELRVVGHRREPSLIKQNQS